MPATEPGSGRRVWWPRERVRTIRRSVAPRIVSRPGSASTGWSETPESNRQRRWGRQRGHAVQTSWAVLSLAACGRRDSEAVRRAWHWLREHQGEDGRWPDQPITGVFNRTCAIHYDTTCACSRSAPAVYGTAS